MGVIKSANSPPSISPFSMKDIENHAKTLLLRARQQADQLLAAAQTEAEQLKASAKAEGLAEGQRQGRAQGLEAGKKAGQQQALDEYRAELQNAVSALSSAATNIDTHRAHLEAQGLHEVVRLALSVARRVSKRQAIIDAEVLAANLSEAMRLVIDASNIRIAIHPSQRKLLDEALPKLAISLPSLQHAQVIEDGEIAPGGCRVFTRNGLVDADLDVQLDRIAADLLPIPESPAEGK
jgi:flagellar assembly protein FliH